jgi:hypothetical protein
LCSIRQERHDTAVRARQRLEHQATSVALQSLDALSGRAPDMIRQSLCA